MLGVVSAAGALGVSVGVRVGLGALVEQHLERSAYLECSEYLMPLLERPPGTLGAMPRHEHFEFSVYLKSSTLGVP